MATITEIKFECGTCRQRMLVDSGAAGMAVSCPSCDAPLVVPRESAPGDGGARMDRTDRAGTGLEDWLDIADDADAGELRQGLADASTENSRLHALLGDARAEIERINASATHAQAEIKSFHNERLSLKSELSQLRQKLAAADARIEAETDTLRQEIAARVSEAGQSAGQLAAAQAGIEALHAREREWEVETGELHRQLEDVQSGRTAALREIEALRRKVSGIEGDLAEACMKLAEDSEVHSRLAQTEGELKEAKGRLESAEARAAGLEANVSELAGQVEGLRKSLGKGEAGRKLLGLQDAQTELLKEREILAGQIRQLTADLQTGEKKLAHAVSGTKSLRRQLDEARREADANTEVRLKVDNEVLRGIVARQNSELEARHVELVRLKRARFFLRLVYALFGLGLVALGIVAVKFIPALRF